MEVYHILYNPLSDNGAGKKVEVESFFPWATPQYHDITTVKDYADFFASVGEETVVLCGGDGTLHRFANDTCGLSIPGKLLYYANGSGNDFLGDIGGKKGDAPIDLKPYLEDLPTVTVQGKTYRFLNNVGFGIDGYCCEVADKHRAVSDKPINYTAIAIKGLLFHFKQVTAKVTVDGKTETYRNVWLAPTMNGRFYGGGMMAAPQQDRLDPEGKLSLLIMYKKSRLATLIAFPSIFKGEHIKKTKMVHVVTGHEMHVEFDRPCALQIDGETFLGVTEYTAHAGAIRSAHALAPVQETVGATNA